MNSVEREARYQEAWAWINAHGFSGTARAEFIGEGGAGRVLRVDISQGHHLNSLAGCQFFEPRRSVEKRVAVKLVFPDNELRQNERWGVQLAGERFNHPHLLKPIAVIDLPSSIGGFAVVMDLAELTAAGEPKNLAIFMACQGKQPLAFDRALEIFLPLVRAVEYLETELGVYHQDIRPENIMLFEARWWKLGDYSLIGAETFVKQPERRKLIPGHIPSRDAANMARVLHLLLHGRPFPNRFPGNDPNRNPRIRLLDRQVIEPAQLKDNPPVPTVKALREAIQNVLSSGHPKESTGLLDPAESLRSLSNEVRRFSGGLQRQFVRALILLVSVVTGLSVGLRFTGLPFFLSILAPAGVFCAFACVARKRRWWPFEVGTWWPNALNAARWVDNDRGQDNLIVTAYGVGAGLDTCEHRAVLASLAADAEPVLLDFLRTRNAGSKTKLWRAVPLALMIAALLLLLVFFLIPPRSSQVAHAGRGTNPPSATATASNSPSGSSPTGSSNAPAQAANGAVSSNFTKSAAASKTAGGNQPANGPGTASLANQQRGGAQRTEGNPGGASSGTAVNRADSPGFTGSSGASPNGQASAGAAPQNASSPRTSSAGLDAPAANWPPSPNQGKAPANAGIPSQSGDGRGDAQSKNPPITQPSTGGQIADVPKSGSPPRPDATPHNSPTGQTESPGSKPEPKNSSGSGNKAVAANSANQQASKQAQKEIENLQKSGAGSSPQLKGLSKAAQNSMDQLAAGNGSAAQAKQALQQLVQAIQSNPSTSHDPAALQAATNLAAAARALNDTSPPGAPAGTGPRGGSLIGGLPPSSAVILARTGKIEPLSPGESSKPSTNATDTSAPLALTNRGPQRATGPAEVQTVVDPEIARNVEAVQQARGKRPASVRE